MRTKKKKIDMAGSREAVNGMVQLGVVVAEASASYILYFNESVSLKVIAMVLIADASHRALTKFVRS